MQSFEKLTHDHAFGSAPLVAISDECVRAMEFDGLADIRRLTLDAYIREPEALKQEPSIFHRPGYPLLGLEGSQLVECEVVKALLCSKFPRLLQLCKLVLLDTKVSHRKGC